MKTKTEITLAAKHAYVMQAQVALEYEDIMRDVSDNALQDNTTDDMRAFGEAYRKVDARVRKFLRLDD